MPVITLEVMGDYEHAQISLVEDAHPTQPIETPQDGPHAAGTHFLTDNIDDVTPVENETESSESAKARTDLLEYMMRNDGSVVCKLCGEILQSRTHWYRHKYKLHVIHPLNPSPLFQCQQCLVYFKSRKGYIGHLASRHSENSSDSSPVLTNADAASANEILPLQIPVKEEPDPELVIPKSSVPTKSSYQAIQTNQTSVVVQPPPPPVPPLQPLPPTKTTETKRTSRETLSKSDFEERRLREEKLVADIIDRVRRECEAQGSAGGARRGYTRRTTVMHT